MRRTYRSKKDTTGTLDHRDVFQNLDEKSSVFDAFYIQNIKQTKRELSCVSSSNQFGFASNKVRKRKYVRRVVKDVETVKPRETMSPTGFLTPDKSFRVNKPLDPFDMLLNSSPACQPPKQTAPVVKDDVFHPIQPKKESKTYTRKNVMRAKKINYSSSDSYESEKENSLAQSNVSDIKAHKLIVEKEPSQSPKLIDESINKILNNISLINNIKRKTSNISFKTPNKTFKSIKDRLSNNHSPILQRSPLCSTPFKEKYRGKSIYNFSPISITRASESPNYVTIIEENNDCNNSIILVPKLSKTNNKPSQTTNEISNVYDEIVTNDNNEITPVKKCNSNEVETKSLAKEEENCVVINGNNEIRDSINDIEEICCNYIENDSVIEKAQSVINCSEHKDVDEIDNMQTTEIDNIYLHTTEVAPLLGFTKVNEDISPNKDIDNSDIKFSKPTSLQNTETELFLGFSRVNQSLIDYKNYLGQFLEDSNVISDANNDSYEESNKDDNSNDDIDKSDSTNSNLTSRSQDSDKESMYDTCSEMSEEELKTEPIVVIERMEDDLFMKYYSKMQTELEKSDDSNRSDTSYNSFKSKDAEVKSDAIEITDSDDIISSNEENNSLEEEGCISFVTTRRRHEFANDSMFLFDNSYGSNSTDCDKTVVSNKLNFNKTALSLNEYKDQGGLDDDNAVADIEVNDEIEKVTDRKSSRLTRYSSSVDITVTEDSAEENVSENINLNNSAHGEVNRLSSITVRKTSAIYRNSNMNSLKIDTKPSIVLQPGKKWERSLSIYRRMTTMADHFDQSLLDDENLQTKGRKYRQSVISTMEMQDSLHNDTITSRRSTFNTKPSRSTFKFVKDNNDSRVSLNSTCTTVYDDLKGFLNEECDDTFIELSKLSLADSEHEVTVLDAFHDTERVTTAKDYVLRRCNQKEAILFDECYPETILKNCHKIGEGVYGEVFLYRGWDGRARVMKIVPVAGHVKVNGEDQKDFHEIISEIVIAMELSALRAPIAEINRQFDEGKDVDAIDLPGVGNATDVFNEVLAVRCVYGPYPSRLLDLWDLFDECKGSENDNPAALPINQQYIVLELANAGQDLESYQFASAQQAHALFQQIAFGLAVGEEAFQFEHRDLHWGNVLIAPTEQKYASFVLRNRVFRLPRCGVAATIIDYSLSRVSLPLAPLDERAHLYNDLAHDEQLFDAVGDYQFQVYRLMRDKLGNEWKNFEPYTNILWLHYTVDKMITALRYKRTNTKIHKHYIEKLRGIRERILEYGSATLYVLTDNEI